MGPPAKTSQRKEVLYSFLLHHRNCCLQSPIATQTLIQHSPPISPLQNIIIQNFIMAPRGPRAQGAAPTGRETRSSTTKSKASSRGGISKRKGPARTDGDGDLDMDASGRRPKKSAASTQEAGGQKSRPVTRSSVPSKRGASRTAQTIIKHLTSGDSNIAARITEGKSGKGRNTSLTFLRVRGLKESKAASNQGGGLNDLLGFLERKASSFLTGRSKRSVVIKKVCPVIEGMSETCWLGGWLYMNQIDLVRTCDLPDQQYIPTSNRSLVSLLYTAN